MNEFFRGLQKNYFYKRILTEPLTYVAGAVLLAVLQIAHFAILGSGWGVTTAFGYWGAWVVKAFGGHPETWAYFVNDESRMEILQKGFLEYGGTIRNIGIVFGALISTLLASQFKLKKIKALRQVVAAVIGGFLMGYGARLALGCNIGALFTAIASWSLSGWVFALFLALGAGIGSYLLKKFFM